MEKLELIRPAEVVGILHISLFQLKSQDSWQPRSPIADAQRFHLNSQGVLRFSNSSWIWTEWTEWT